MQKWRWVDARDQAQRNGWEGGVMATKIWRDDVHRLMRNEAGQLVEVLPPPMFEDEHIEGAINIPLKDLNERTTSGLDKDRPVIVY